MIFWREMHFAYFFGTSLFIIPWAILFLHRKDLRKEMLWSSILVGIGGVICEDIWYTHDWVHPITLTNTLVGVEDFIMAFCAGGIASVLFKEILRRTDYKSIRVTNRFMTQLPILLGFLIADLLFRYFGIFSYTANLIGFGFLILIIFLSRRDLIKEAIIGGLFLVLVTLPIYWLTFFFFPGWQLSYWNMTNISQYYFVGIPYEDLVWWLLVGMILSVVYDYTHGMRVRREARR